MKMVISLLLCLCLFSCKTSTQSYKENRDVSYMEYLKASSKGIVHESLVDSVLKKLSFNITVNVTKFAPSDSTGRQDIESITQIIASGEQITEQNTNKTVDGELNTDVLSGREMKDKSIIQAKKDTDSRLFRPPEWWWIALGLAGICLVFVVRKKIKSLFNN